MTAFQELVHEARSIRVEALGHAVAVVGDHGNPAEIVEVAEAFLTFLTAGDPE